MTPHRDYRSSHRKAATAQAYDEGFRDPRTTTGMLWSLEQSLLRRFLETHRDHCRRALDFACGSGRILSLLEEYAGHCVGVDISGEMIRLAQQHCQSAQLVEGDVTRTPTLVEGRFDLITAFRFFLQAEHSLRSDALEWIRSVLAPDGYFVANYHMNPTSLRGALRRTQALVRRRTHRSLSISQACRLLEGHGFVVEQLLGYCHMFYPSVPRGKALWRRKLDVFLAERQILPSLGSSFILIARLEK